MSEPNEEKYIGTCSRCEKTSKEYEDEQKPYDITICDDCYKYICKINSVPIKDVFIES
jgi:hypothetical protein